ncbi:hypothetical protein KEU06_20910 [Pseudaminobacter sp. 19-2017]|uniref:Uncharacterized protein n=1 Tax=Pseudaminobacter soli (ex Zhang et al. 2022) TaxID=2831468 RepID=A0A942E0F8_9HYPH|nr:hypothetical protein [Pseudaminobacter soli]MBS3651076.1 hypothetical protein [Pseudaminobacter soli]
MTLLRDLGRSGQRQHGQIKPLVSLTLIQAGVGDYEVEIEAEVEIPNGRPRQPGRRGKEWERICPRRELRPAIA